MNKIGRIIRVINRTIGFFGLGLGIGRIFEKDYKLASFVLLAVSVLFAIEYSLEKYKGGLE